MKKIFEVYTKDGKLDDISVNEFIKVAEQTNGWNYEQIARYVYQDDNGRNTLVECDIPTLENDDKTIFLTTYEYKGDFENYMAEQEVICEAFNGDWSSLELQMETMAKSE